MKAHSTPSTSCSNSFVNIRFFVGLLFAVLILLPASLQAQTYYVPYSGTATAVYTNGGTVYDHAGSSNYSTYADGYLTIYPATAGAKVKLSGSYDTESSYWDWIDIYNGPSSSSPSLGRWGGSGTLSCESTDATGALTIHFRSDGSICYSGFVLTISLNYPCDWESYAGTASDPYLIYDAQDLECFRNKVNEGNTYSGKYFKLMDDIALTGNWTPIGNSTNKFYGNFDGDGHTISGLSITSSSSYQGLFGYTYNASISNLTVDGSVSGSSYTGGIVGYAYYTSFNNCINRCTVSSTSSYVGGIVGYDYSYTSSSKYLQYCKNYGDISGSSYVGGITGYTYAYSSSSYKRYLSYNENHGDVTATYSYVGGITGCTYYSVYYNYNENYGNVSGSGYVGGIIGEHYYTYGSSVLRNVNKGRIQGTSSYVGGIIGYYYASSYTSYCQYNDNYGDVNSSYSSNAYVGGIVGYAYSSTYKYIQYNANAGKISSNGYYVGGILGYGYYTYTDYNVNAGQVSSTYSSSAYVGGIVGYNSSYAYSRYNMNAGEVKGYNYIGGIVGYQNSYSYLSYCLNVGNVITTSGSYRGGIAGYASGSSTSCYWDNQMCTATYQNYPYSGSSYRVATSTLLNNVYPSSSYFTRPATGMYPVPSGMSNREIARVAASPVTLSGSQTISAVSGCMDLYTGTNSYPVVWSNPASSSVVAAGTYGIVTTAGSGELVATCGDASKVVNMTTTSGGDALTVTASPATICPGESSVLSVSAPAGYSISSYTWLCNGLQVGTGTSLSVTPDVTTTYSVTGATGSCPLAGSITITVDAPAATLVASVDGCIDAGASVTLSAENQGLMPSTYTGSINMTSYNTSRSINPGQMYHFYDNGGPNGSYSSYGSGYSYTYTAPAGSHVTLIINSSSFESCCDYISIYDGNSTSATRLGTSSGNSTWNNNGTPFVSSGNSLTVYFYSDYSVTYSGWDATVYCPQSLNYAWSTGATTNSIDVTPTSSTDYTVTVSGDTYSCSTILSHRVKVNPDLQVSPSNPRICPGSTIQLTAAGADNYQWSNGYGSVVSNTALYTAGAGTFAVAGTTNDGCSATTSVTVEELSNASAGTIDDVDACQSDAEIILTSTTDAVGGGNVEYRWTIGSRTSGWSTSPEYTLSSADRTALGTGVYSVTRSYRDGCGNSGSASATLTINAAMTAPTVSGNTTLMCGQSTTLSATSNYDSNPNLVYRWYSDPQGQNLVHTGADFTTPSLETNTTYYLQISDGHMAVGTPQNFASSGAYTYQIPADAVQLKLETWGAQGGTYSSYTGGLGGYSVGTLTNLNNLNTLYVYVGGAGSSNTTGGYNGGGNGVYSGRGGGGATDIRTASGDLYSRIIVAGGGGGAGVSYGSTYPAGCGGGLYGGDGYYNYTNGTYVTGTGRSGGGATPTQGGISWNSITSTRGTFGVGGNAYNYSCGGGGGGWYGGGGAYDSDSDSDGRYGGGGSGYVWTSTNAAYAPVGYQLTSDYYLTNAQTIAGNTSFLSPSGSYETGHSGNGYARITPYVFVQDNCSSNMLPVTITVNQMPAPQVVVNSACIGQPSEMVVVNPVNGYDYQWSTDPTFATIAYTGTTYTPTVNTTTQYYVRSVQAMGSPVTNLTYTGSASTFTVPAGVSSIQVELWGADGGDCSYNGALGGHGGYTSATMSVNAGETLQVNVGGRGHDGSGSGYSANAGGWNGGGSGAYGYSYFSAAGGGGASDIRLNGTALSDRVLVAGGGGGAAYYCGGNAGGTTGSTACTNYGSRYGYGASSYSGGSGGTDGSSTNGSAGSLGTGGAGGYGSAGGGGGGAGYYGGGGGASGSACAGGGGGGNGYVAAGLIGSTMAYTSAPANPDATGNGYARITLLNYSSSTCPSLSATVTLTPESAPSFTLTHSSSSYCQGQSSVQLAVTNPSANVQGYTWSTGETTQSVAVTPGHTTTYYVSVSAANCAVKDSVTISVDAPEATISASPDGCVDAGDEVVLMVGAGGTAGTCPAYINQSNGTTILSPGCELLFYDDGGQYGNYSNSQSLTHTFTSADGSPISIVFSSCGGESCCDYLYLRNGTSSSYTTLRSGYIYSTPTNTTYTATSGSLTVYSTSDGSVNGSGWVATIRCGYPRTYAWSTGDDEASVSVTPTQTTTYHVTVSDNQHACPAILDYTINVNPTVEISASAENVCLGSSSTLTASGADYYVWNNAETTTSVDVYPSSTSTYTVTGTTSAGCSATASVEVGVVTSFSAGAVSGSAEACLSDASATIPSTTDGIGGGTVEYKWVSGSHTYTSSNPTYTLSSAEMASLGEGIHTFTRYFKDECFYTSWQQSSGTFTLTLNGGMPAPTVSGDTNVVCGTSTTLTASGYVGNDYYYRWYADAAGTQLLHEGTEFTTPMIEGDTTFYLQVERMSAHTQTSSFSYTGAEQVYPVPAGARSAVLSVYGAQGGYGRYSSYSTYQGGYGGYASGTIDLTGIENLYVNVGGQGTSAPSYTYTYAALAGGYNGGGNSGYHGYSGSYYQGGAGGGATHIATRSGLLSTLENNQSDVLIVAGGGGGGGYSYTGGAGGGTNGGAYSTSTSNTTYYGQGGTQTAGGIGSYSDYSYDYSAEDGSFGQGGQGGNTGTYYATGGAGGGGGWYGGGGGRGGSYTSCYPGGGGSGYLNPALSSASMTSGTRSGNGYATITTTYFVREECPSEMVAVRLHKISPEDPIVTVSACTGQPAELTVSNPIPGYSYIWSTDPEGNNPVDTAIVFTPTVNSATTYYVRGAIISEPITNFAYTGSEQVYTVPAGVSQVRLEVWGAQGGNSTYHGTTGGCGGYSSGLLNVIPGQSLYVYVGGAGSPASYGVYGGWNGGGGVTNTYHTGGSGNHIGTGGGATDISTVGGGCTADAYYRYVRSSQSYNGRVIVAGGGGGAEGTNGTAGGGTSGVDTYAGTQNASGSAYINDASSWVTLYAGGFGYGASTTGGHTNHAMGGCGGGGWYGGGAYANNGYNARGFGGSGYIGGVLNGTTIAGNQSMTQPNGTIATGHTGNGYARITVTQSGNNRSCQTSVVTVSVTPYPAPTVQVTASSTESCNQSEVELTITHSNDVLSMTLSNGITERGGRYFVTPSRTTTYTVTVTNLGCSVSDDVTIHVAAPEVNLYVSDSSACLNNGAALTLNVLSEGGGEVQSASEYLFSVRNETFQTMSGGTTALSSYDDGYATVPIGFTFNYCGNDYSQARLSTNGFIQFGSTTASCSNYLGTSSYPNVLAAFWDDLYGNTVKYQTTGTAPNRVFTMQHYGYDLNSSSYYFYYQIKLYETSNKIEYWYGPGFSSSIYASAAIGLNGNSSSFSFQSVTPTGSGTATVSTTTANNSISYSTVGYLTNGTVYSFTPATQLSYYWNTGDETASISVNPTEDQTYTVTVSSASYNCDAVLSYDVHVKPNVEVTSQPEAICAGSSAVLTASGADSYTWNGGNTGATYTASSAGIYSVVGTTQAGCSATASYTLEIPVFTAGSISSGSTTVCASETEPLLIRSSVDGQGGGNTAYRWSYDGNVLPQSDTASFTVPYSLLAQLNGGTHTFTREFYNACDDIWVTSTGSYSVTITPAVELAVDGNLNVDCGTGTTLTASGFTGSHVVYNWYSDEACTQLVHTGATFEVDNVEADVTYYVQATDTYEDTQVTNFNYTGSVQTYTIPAGANSLLLEVWGAQGGNSTYGGKGGYSTGVLSNLSGLTNLYVYVGQQPSGSTGGWNGGGGYSSFGSSGGGATDISLHNYTSTTASHFNDRLIVAGGGGGKGYSSTYGGAGGGTAGITGGSGSTTPGGGATQTAGGTSYSSTYRGIFGTAATSSSHNGGGGGGGWYGGGAGNSGGTDSGGGGGSGFTWTGQATVPATYAVSAAYVLTNARTVAGNTSFTAPSGSSETGHTGAGYARITANIYVSSGCPSLVKAVSIHLVPATAPVINATSPNVVCGTSTTLSVENPNNDLLYQWSTDPTFATILHTGTTYSPVVGNDVTYYVRSVPQSVIVDPTDFSYTGGEQRYVVPEGISQVQLEVWGAQGGDGCHYSGYYNPVDGGHGGYSSGVLNVVEGQTLYVYVGQQGLHNAGSSSAWNGGGAQGVSSFEAGTGGGATDIRVNGTDLSNRVIVAGGGGGGGNESIGGAGGGLSGVQPSSSTQFSSRIAGVGGTQNSGYQLGVGQGSNGVNLNGGGGGGYYGGRQGDNSTGGGGGSGYIGGVTSGITIAGDQSMPAPDGTTVIGRTGNGYARITPIGMGVSPCVSANAQITLTVTSPEDVQTHDVEVDCGTTAHLTVDNAVPGLYYDWYADSACTQLVHQGATWDIDNVGAQQTYYVRSYGLNQIPGTEMMDSIIEYSGSTFEFVVPQSVGEVTLQVWGAQGGNVYYGTNRSTSQYGGKGGYAAGKLLVDEGTTLYVNVGGQGENGSNGTVNVAPAGGYNGGGYGGIATSSSVNYYPGAGGGGATDIRLGSNNVNDRILVAGGGGGAAYHATPSSVTGGYGGGVSGTDGYSYLTNRYGRGAVASGPGAGGTNGSASNGTAGTNNASGGVGGTGGNGPSGGAGGGGGYYGGGAGASGNPESGAGGGGRGYVGDTLTQTSLVAGNSRMPSPTGGYMTGRTGNGIAVVSYIRPVNDTLCMTNPVAVTVSARPLAAPQLDDMTTLCGTPTVLAINNTNSSSTYIWYADSNCTQEVNRGATYSLEGSENTKDTTYYVKAYSSLLASSREGQQGFAFTNGVQTFDIPAGVSRITMEVWGADGGTMNDNLAPDAGGQGGYSVGTLTNLQGLNQLYIYVGGSGSTNAGGYNGGETALAGSGGGGGGASDISLVNVAANTTEHYNNRLIVAGGGGGSGTVNANRTIAGGYGGGINAGAGDNGTTSSMVVAGGNGGSQTSAGYNDDNANLSGIFGAANTAVSTNGGGGGGGWYGGASGAGNNTHGGGGGGSGFVWTQEAYSNGYVPATYNVSNNYYLINANTIAGNSTSVPNKPVDTKNGYVLIHYYFPEQYLCESEKAAVSITTTPIELPWMAYATDDGTNILYDFCSGSEVPLYGYAEASTEDSESEIPMIVWYNSSNQLIGASASDSIFTLLPSVYGDATQEYYYAYAATDLVSMSGSFTLSTGQPMETTSGKGVFVDVTASANMTIDGMSFYPRYSGEAAAKVYYRRGSCLATATNAQGWNGGTAHNYQMVPGQLCNIEFDTPVAINAGETYTFYIVSDNDLYYRNYGLSSNNTAGIVPGQLLDQYSTNVLGIYAGFGTADGHDEFSSSHSNSHFLGQINYTLHGETQFGCMSQDGYSVEVYFNLPSSIEGMSITAPAYVCHGNEATLTAVNGSQGDGASYVWTSDSCNGTIIASGADVTYSSISVTPTQTTTYYVKFVSDVCGSTNCVEKTVYVLDAPMVSDIVAPERICARAPLGIAAPQFVTYLPELGVTVNARGWQCSADGVNYTEFTDSTAVGESYNDYYVRYYVTTDCATGYSNAVQITVDSLPVITPLVQPDPICSPNTFDWVAYTPTVEYHNNSSAVITEGWRVNIDGTDVAFDPSMQFSYGQDIKVRYFVSNACGEVETAPVTLTFWTAPYADALASLDEVCAGLPFGGVAPVTHEFGGHIYKGWEYTTVYGSQLYTRFSADTIVDYGMNGYYIRYYIGNECGAMNTDPVQLIVKDVPALSTLVSTGTVYCSGDAFDIVTPSVVDNGGVASINTGWYLSADSAFSPTNTLTEVNVANGIDADTWNNQWLRYADTNACGVGYSNAIQIAVHPSHHLTVTPAESDVCLGPVYQFEAHSDIAGATYAWTGQGLNANSGNAVSAQPSAPGDWTYAVTAHESEFGCDATAEAILHVSLISKDTAIHLCASDLDYVFDAVEYPNVICTQSGNYSYQYITANGCDSVVNLSLSVTYPIERQTRIHYCNYSPEYVWPVTGEHLGGPTMKDTVIYRQSIVPCQSSFSDLDGHQCDSIIYSLQFTISNEPYVEVPVTDITVPVSQPTTASFNVRKDCDFPGVKLAVSYNLYKDDTLIDVVSDYGHVEMTTTCPMVGSEFGDEVRIGSGEIPGNTYNMYNYNFNYFYANYFCTVDNNVKATWNQPGEYKLELVVVRKSTDRGMAHAFMNAEQQLMGGDGAWSTDSIFSDTVYIYYHVGTVDTMPEQTLTYCESELPQYFAQTELTESGYYEVFMGNEGHFQMYPINVVINPTVYNEFDVQLSNCVTSYEWEGQYYYSAGDYTRTLQSVVTGCDSIVTMHLSVNSATDTIYFTDNVDACGSYSWIDGSTYTNSGTYSYETTYGTNSCPAVYTINLTVNETFDTTVDVVVAPLQFPYAYDDNHVFATAGTYDIVYNTVTGCDSTIHLNVIAATTAIDLDTNQFAPVLGDTAIFDINVIGGGLTDRKVALDYEITRNGEIIDNVNDYGTVYFATDYADIHRTIGRNLNDGLGSIPANTFNVLYYNYKYFYLDFFNFTTNHMTAQWRVPGEYKIKFYLREREGGEDFDLTYNHSTKRLGGGGSVTVGEDLVVDSVVMRYEIDTVRMSFDTTICASELPFYYHGVAFNEATNTPARIEFGDAYQINDTVVTFTLNVNPTYSLYDTAYLCAGDSYQDANFTLTADEIAQRAGSGDVAVFTLNGQTAQGCDSVVTLTIYVKPLPNLSIFTHATTVCVGTPIRLTASGADEYLWSGTGATTSAIDTTPNQDITIYVTGTSNYVLPTTPTVSTTTYLNNREVMISCTVVDSIEITAVPLGTHVYDTATICQGMPYDDGVYYVEEAKTAVVGAIDTTIEVNRTTCGVNYASLHLVVTPTYNATFGYIDITDEVCEGYAYNANGFNLSADSIAHLRLANPTHVSNDVVVYNQGVTTFGCDSITRLTLHVNPTVYSDTTIHFCNSVVKPMRYVENGQTFQLNGDTIIDVLYAQAVTGCDSVSHVTVVFDAVPTVEITGTDVCANVSEAYLNVVATGANVDSIKWMRNGSVIPSSPVSQSALTVDESNFNDALTMTLYAGACVITENVVINTLQLPTVTIDTAICAGTSYFAPNGTDYTAAGTYNWYASSNEGCDTSYTLNLTVNPIYNISIRQSIRAAELPYEWNGYVFNAAGRYTAYLFSQYGCDSTVTLDLSLIDTLSGDPFMNITTLGDNQFNLQAFANQYDIDSKVAIDYTLYKDGVPVMDINGECGGSLYLGTEFQGSYIGTQVTAPTGSIPANTFSMMLNYYDYYYFHFLNGRNNLVAHDFTEAGDYEIVFQLRKHRNGLDLQFTYDANGVARNIGGYNSEASNLLATQTLAFTVDVTVPTPVARPTLLLNNASQITVDTATSTVYMTCVGNGYNDNAQVSVNYTIVKDNQPLSVVSNAGELFIGTYMPNYGDYVGNYIVSGTGSLPMVNFNLMGMFNYDFFYMNFFENTRSNIIAHWTQPGDYQIVFDLVEMSNGVDYGITYDNAHSVGGYNASQNGNVLSNAVLNYHVTSVGQAAPEQTTGVVEAADEAQMSIFPNPANTLVNIQGVSTCDQMTITDVNGKVLYHIDGTQAAAGNVQVNVSTWAAGIYFVNVIEGNAVSTQKFVVTK